MKKVLRKSDILRMYAEDGKKAEEMLLGMSGRKISRGKFLTGSALLTLGGILGGKLVFGKNYPSGLIPAGIIADETNSGIPGKSDQLIILNDKPWNAEPPPHLLDPEITPADIMFVRNNGIPPVNVDPAAWTLTIEGESAQQKKTFTLDELKRNFSHHNYRLTLECAGNGRAEYNPAAKGAQWTLGAVGCCEWTGVRLKDVLQNVGIKDDAVYIGYYGADTHLSGDQEKYPISRGVPIRKALEDESLIAWAMNGKEIPLMNGAPLRLVFGGWPASTSGKWLKRIVIRNKIHDGEKMGGDSYKIPRYPVAPGAMLDEKDMDIIESMPVKSLITYPKSGAMIKGSKSFEVRGHAWAGDLEVKEVHCSIDFGATWKKCELNLPVNRLAWQRWRTTVQLPEKGYYEIWCRAVDSKGKSQPMVIPGWNPKGYLNNACHRIAVKRNS